MKSTALYDRIFIDNFSDSPFGAKRLFACVCSNGADNSLAGARLIFAFISNRKFQVRTYTQYLLRSALIAVDTTR